MRTLATALLSGMLMLLSGSDGASVSSLPEPAVVIPALPAAPPAPNPYRLTIAAVPAPPAAVAPSPGVAEVATLDAQSPGDSTPPDGALSRLSKTGDCPFELRAIVAGGESDAFAMVQLNGESELVRVGTRLPGVRVVAIESNVLKVRVGGAVKGCSLDDAR